MKDKSVRRYTVEVSHQFFENRTGESIIDLVSFLFDNQMTFKLTWTDIPVDEIKK